MVIFEVGIEFCFFFSVNVNRMNFLDLFCSKRESILKYELWFYIYCFKLFKEFILKK